jgi:hypothetical protein
MEHPVSDRRVPCHDESGIACEQSDYDQRARDQFDAARDADHRHQLDAGWTRYRESEPFLKAMLKEQKAEHDSEYAENLRLILVELRLDTIHSAPPPL